MTTREITIAFELAIAIFAIYLLVRRLARMGARDREAPPFYVQEPQDDPSRGAGELVTVAWFRRIEEAEMWAETLRGQGIEAAVTNRLARMTEGGRPPELQVRFEDANQAVEILREASESATQE